ncbi:SDR family NAD(P)-dependent oxidoreductase [Streptomyces sp. NPDC056943]|uniref:SDR family NAD(P)-dependent oxidoreductase n=1 Tax=Streptomyces sp. NPDC056943 TaxID=3345971 RepID=UPI00364212B4
MSTVSKSESEEFVSVSNDAGSAHGTAEPVAVVGISCRVPGARDPGEFWELLTAGGQAVTDVPADRWNAADLYDPDRSVPGRMNTRWGGFIEDVDRFDAAFFGISPREAAEMDPQQRLALELGWEALERAGIDPSSLTGTRTGVFAGAIWDDYATLKHRQGTAAITPHTVTGLHRGVIANRLSYTLGLRGPSLVVDSGQSSSLVAVHLACESLRRGESELALAGGVSLNLVPDSTIGASKFGGLSPDGRAYTFDARANGYVRGEGGGFVVLKRLSRAIADGDPVLAVIRGSAVNNGGAVQGMTTPDAAAQEAVLREAHAQAGTAPSDVRYVELHGTGTPVGDPIEAAALGAALGTGRPAGQPLLVGSVKTNIGHLEGAAGIAGLIKAVLALRGRALPASLNYETPNPAIPFEELNLKVNTAYLPWEPERDGQRMVVGVSSFGMGGTNAHVVLEEAPAPAAASDSDSDSDSGSGSEAAQAVESPAAGVVPWVVSAKTAGALDAQLGRLAAFADARTDADAGAVARVLAGGRAQFEHRAVAIGAGRDDLAAALAAPEGLVRGVASGVGRVAFVFPGQGTQWAGMGAELLDSSVEFAAAMAECEAALAPYVDWSLEAVVRQAPGAPSLERVDVVQPVTFAVMVSLARVWQHYGVTPQAVVGHSQGEIAAAYVAGALSLDDAARVVALRSKSIAAHLAGKGGMLSLALSESAVLERLVDFDGLSVAAVNGPTATVVSGDPGQIEELARACKADGFRARIIPVDYASHSAQVEIIEAELAEVLAGLAPRTPEVPFFSTLEGAWITGPVLDGAYWYRNLRHRVGFAPAVETLATDEGFTHFVEVSAHPVLTMALPETVTGLGTLRREEGGLDRLVTSLAEAWTNGLAVDWSPLLPATAGDAGLPDLPTYAFQTERHWLGEIEALAPAAELPVQPAVLRTEAAELATLDRDEQLRVILDKVRAQTAQILGYASGARIDVDRTFREAGCTSLTGVDLRNRINAAFGVRMAPSMIFDFPTPEALAEQLLVVLHGEALGQPAGGAEPLPAGNGVTDEPIAIVGMACRLPGGVASPEDLWRLVAGGGDAISGFPDDRGWDVEGLYHPDPEHPGTSYVRQGGFIENVAGFDAAFFGISPREALAMDPQQRLLLETSWEAVEDAGIDPTSLRGQQVGVFTGAMTHEYGPSLRDGGEGLDGYLLTGNTASVMSGRVSYTLGLEGPALTVDTACSSSLVALHLAVQALRKGEVDMALAGGVAVMPTPGMFVEFSRQRGLAGDGRSKAFAASADGTSWAEGVGVLLVERLSDARRNGHQVLAVVRGSAVNQDGASNGLTAPNGPSQQRVIQRALADARLTAADVDVVEAHGTGTRLGDPIEAQALIATYGQERNGEQPLRLGSLKSNIGHTQAAAGVSGVIKMVQAMRHGVLPKTLHVDEPSDQIDWSAGAVELLTEAMEWPEKGDGGLRRAAVSSFGISGTNAHVVLEEAPAASDSEAAQAVESPAAGVVPWLVSAKSPAALDAQIGRLASYADGRTDLDAGAVARVLAGGRAAFEHRAVALGAGQDALVQALAAPEELIRGTASDLGRVAFAFPGQGTQWAGMGAELLDSSEEFAAAMAECETALAPYVDWSLEAVVRQAPGAPSLERVDVVQPVTFAVMVSLARVWQHYGVTPQAVVGHSQGEIAAAYVAGALTLDGAARVVTLRSQSIATHLAGKGGMLSLALSESAVLERLADFSGLSIAAVNGPTATVVSGDPVQIEELARACKADGFRARIIPVDYASHSAQVEIIEAELAELLAGLTPQTPRVPFYSTLEGGWVTEPALDGAYWYRNLRHRVGFAPAVETLATDEGFTHFIEVSAHPVLTMALPETVTGLGTLRREQGGQDRLVTSLAEAWTSGLPVDWTPLLPAAAGRPGLPTYAFQAERYWLQSTPPATTADDWRYRVDWKRLAGTEQAAQNALSGRWLAVTPEDRSSEAAAVLAALTEAGATVEVLTAGADDDREALAARIAGLTDGDAFAGVVSLLDALVPQVAWVQALGDAAVTAPLWSITRNAVSIGRDDTPADPDQAMLWGLGRVVALEHPERWAGLVDLPTELDTSTLDHLMTVLAGSTGEDQIAIRTTGLHARRLARAPLHGRRPTRDWQPHGTILITGGTGALGSHAARWMAEHGAEHLLLVSRSGDQAPGATQLADELGTFGARVTIAACDVADPHAMRTLLDTIPADTPLTAVLHTAGALDDGIVDTLTAEQIQRAHRAKAVGAAVLDELTRDLDLDAFVLFSSVSSTLGIPGQGNYAPHNAYLDALAARRRARGQTAVAVAWGPWDGGGMASGDGVAERLHRHGVPGMDPELALAALESVLGRDETAVTVAHIDWDRFYLAYSSGRAQPLVEELPEVRRIIEARESAAAGQGASPSAGGNPLAERLAAAAPGERTEILLGLVRTQAAAVLRMRSPEDVDSDRAFKDIGFDSLAGVELRNRLTRATGLKLPATLVFDYPTPLALVSLLRTEFLGEEETAETTGAVGSGESRQRPVRGSADGDTDTDTDTDPIAIVAMSCRFPGGVRSPEDLWRMLSEGGEGITPFPTDRGWDLEGLYDADPDALGRAYVREGGFLHDAAEFDAEFFGVSPREALAMDPQQRMLLATSWEAFERAGIEPGSLRGSSTGVFIGLSYQDYAARVPNAPRGVEGYLLTGNTASVASGRIAYTFGLEGPATTVDTACSSSLTALHLAVRALRGGECTMALAGGVAMMATPHMFVEFSRQRALAPDGRSKAFSADADGFGAAEGVGLLLVERLSDARRNGHPVLAVVRGTAVNQDGASNGLTAPNGPSQQRVIRQALADARLAPGDIDAVETHGTGTALGDPIEAQGLQATYGKERPAERPLAIGSVKSNIGHTQAAAGAAGIMKMVLAMRHGTLPKTLHADEPSPHVDWASSGLALVTEPIDWPSGTGPRRAAVSSFGISGTNAHVVLEEAPEPLEAAGADGAAGASGADGMSDASVGPVECRPGHLPWVLSAKDEQSLRGQAAALHAWLSDTAAGTGAESAADLRDVGYALATSRTAFPQRAAVTAADRDGFLDGLATLARGGTSAHAHRDTARDGSTAFLFTGQGSQRPGAGRELYERYPVFIRALDEICAHLDAHLELPLLDVMFAAEGSAEAALLDETRYTQCALFALEVALFRLVESWGMRPAALLGHSVGEIAAAHVAGVFSLADAALLVAARGRLMQELPAGGAMLAVQAAGDEIRAWLESEERYAGRLDVAAVNGPEAAVLSGDADAAREAEAHWSGLGRRTRMLRVSHAFHSAHMDGMLDAFRAVLETVEFRRPSLTVVSNVTGLAAGPDELCDPEYWVRHVRETVRFLDGVRFLRDLGVRTCLELGPDGVLTAMAADGLAEPETSDAGSDAPAVAPRPLLVALLRRKRSEAETVADALGRAHAHGTGPDWDAWFAGSGARRVDLPTYSFRRDRYWLDAPAGDSAADTAGLGLGTADHPLLGAVVSLPDRDGLLLTGRLSLRTHPWLADHAVLGSVLLPGTAMVELAAHAAESAGLRDVRELTLREPLVLPERDGVELRVTVGEPAGDGARPVSLHSRLADAPAGTPWSCHATGVLGSGSGESAGSGEPTGSTETTGSGEPTGSTATVWPPQGAEEVPLDGLYERLHGNGLDFGPLFQGLSAVWRYEGEVLAEIALPTDAPASAAADRYGIHPALLDASLHAIAVGGLVDEPERVRVPFHWSGVTVHAAGAAAARVRLAAAGKDAVSLSLTDGEGRPLVSVERLTLRPVSADQAAAGRVGGLMHRVAWRPYALASAGTGQGEHTSAYGPTAVLGRDELKVAAALESAGVEVGVYPDLAALAQDVAAGAPAPRTVLAPLPAGPADGGAETVRSTVVRTLELLQAWLADEHLAGTRLVLVTRGAVRDPEGPGASDGGGEDLSHAAAWGLVRTAQTENPGRFGLLDLADDEPSYRALPAVLSEAALRDEPQLALHDGTVRLARLAAVRPETGTDAPGLDPEGTVLVTGGTGGLGGVVARHVVSEWGVRRLLLVSRRGTDAPGAAELVTELEGLGAVVSVAACDVADRDSLTGVLAGIPAEHPLTAVVHTAGVLSDGTVPSTTAADVEHVLRPKVDAAFLLDELTSASETDLAAFVMFSSAAAAFGGAGQGAYAAANATLDALAWRRQASGLPALSLGWGLWAEKSGMTGGLGKSDLRRMSRAGIGGISDAEGTALLDAALRDGRYPVLLPLRLDTAGLRDAAGNDPAGVPALFRDVVGARTVRPRPAASSATATQGAQGAPGTAAHANEPAAATLAERAAAVDGSARQRLLLEFVVGEVAEVLGHARGHRIDAERGFLDLGFDSLTAVELRNRLNSAGGLALPATLVFDHPSPAALATHLDAELPRGAAGNGSGDANGNGSTASRSTADTDALLAQLTRLEGALVLTGLSGAPGSEEVLEHLRSLRSMVTGDEGTGTGAGTGTPDGSGSGSGSSYGAKAEDQAGGRNGGGNGDGADVPDFMNASAEELFGLLDLDQDPSTD